MPAASCCSTIRAAAITQAGARRWLEVRPVRSHHHLRPGQAKDYDRLARFLLGQSTGFLASATGVYGAATLGVYKAVLAGGFEFDCFSGTGTGAAIAACLALGMDADDIDQLITEMMVSRPRAQAQDLARLRPLRSSAASTGCS